MDAERPAGDPRSDQPGLEPDHARHHADRLSGRRLPGSNEFGLGDFTPTFFFSPKKPTAGGLVWGIGPVFLLPTATDDLLGTEK
jgi:hypothetical protein